MRAALAACLVLLLGASAATAAPRPRPEPGVPSIRSRTPYEAARRQLAQAGFRPVAFRVRPSVGICSDGLCRRAPEIFDCSSGGDISQCLFLFVRRRDGRFLTLRSVSNGDDRFGIAYWTPRDELDWLTKEDYRTVIPSDRALLRAAKARIPDPPYREPKHPLCSESHGATPCWVKPPADYSK